eukprot:12432649-Alexandrium_andersonii.AAC.1
MGANTGGIEELCPERGDLPGAGWGRAGAAGRGSWARAGGQGGGLGTELKEILPISRGSPDLAAPAARGAKSLSFRRYPSPG